MREGCEIRLDMRTGMTSGFQEVPGEEVRERSGPEKENGKSPVLSRNEAAAGEGGGRGEEPRAENLGQVEAGREEQKCGRDPQASVSRKPGEEGLSQRVWLRESDAAKRPGRRGLEITGP